MSKLQSSKNNNFTKKENIPHYVWGSGQPTYPVTKQYARAKLIKHLPWNKCDPLPSEDNMLQIYEQFQTDENCPLSLKVSFECIRNIQELYNRGNK